MNYESAVRYLLSLGRELAAPTQAAAAKFDLENITVLSERLGRPDRAYPSLHIAGTNGKGSTAALLESILRCAGFRTGLYTSPHLEKINERIRVNGEPISDTDFAQTLARIQPLIEELLAEGILRAHPTFFECVTAMAFEYFAHARVEFAVFEVGLGGRLDATNLITPVLSVITKVDFDHENFLGHSLREIAAEKAGIIKEHVPVIVAPQFPEALDIIRARAEALGAPLVDTAQEYRVEQIGSSTDGFARAVVTETATNRSLTIAPNLRGQFQLQNAVNAVAAARRLQQQGYRITNDAIQQSIAKVVWPGRLEKLQSNPDVYLDGAHNPSAARELIAFLKQNFAGRKIFLVYGALRDKAVDEIAGLLFPCATEVVITEPATSRAISASILADMTSDYAKKASVIANPEQAIESMLAKAKPDDAIFVTGSLYLVGQIREYWQQRSQLAVR